MAVKRDNVGCEASPGSTTSGVNPAVELHANRMAGSRRNASASS